MAYLLAVDIQLLFGDRRGKMVIPYGIFGAILILTRSVSPHQLVCTENLRQVQNPNDSYSFFTCVNNVPVLEKCPEDTWFNETLQDCMRLQESDYDNMNGYAFQNWCNDCSLASRYRADEDDCERFWKCQNGEAILQTCTSGLLFNRESGTCDFAKNVNCTTSPNGDIDDLCWDCNESMRYQQHSDCNKFWRCVKGKKEVVSCPEGLYFNPVKDNCDLAVNVYCPKGNTEEPKTSEEPVTESNPAQQDRNPCVGAKTHFIPHETDCTRYYFCATGRPIELRCDSGKEFDPVVGECVSMGQSGCFALQGIAMTS